MDADEMALQRQIEAHKKRLRILQERAAIQGINTPPEILIEIEEIKGEIQEIQTNSKNVGELYDDFNLKYYIYVSDTKIEMLYYQLFNSLTVLNKQESRYYRLRKVLNHLEEHGLIGEIDEQTPYIRGVVSMKWVNIDFGSPGKRTGVVLFCGEGKNIITEYVEGPRLIALGGSIFHLVEFKSESRFKEYDVPGTGAGPISHAIQYYLNLDDEAIRQLNTGILWDFHKAYNRIDGPEQRVEFVARRLLQDQFTILGTPIYVSLAD